MSYQKKAGLIIDRLVIPPMIRQWLTPLGTFSRDAAQKFAKCLSERKVVKRKMPAIRSKEITYRLCKALKETLCTTQALTCIELQGLPLRERDLAALAKVGVV